jgi:hypothetical protein
VRVRQARMRQRRQTPTSSFHSNRHRPPNHHHLFPSSLPACTTTARVAA